MPIVELAASRARGTAPRASASSAASRAPPRPHRARAAVRERRAPERHDRVADVLVDRSVMLVDDLGHRRQVGVHQRRQLARLQVLRHRREIAHVAEEHRELVALALHREAAARSRASASRAPAARIRRTCRTDAGSRAPRAGSRPDVPHEQHEQHHERRRERDDSVVVPPEPQVARRSRAPPPPRCRARPSSGRRHGTANTTSIPRPG